ncbi:MAG: RluA family pseudouridine synthase [Treponema sp.]|nr:RluA family pseudouridine synthase [Spirochaetia bacterium]MDD7459298.1 RluA family pseudouridine synthase [Spirochaetales bacterium]MDY5811292.1 RluA family pseudouridine synthase [Treponema sp.]
MKQNNDYTVIYSDDDVVVFNKRSGLLIAADRYDAEAPRLDVAAEKEFGRLFAVHRIDKDTSGLVIYARNPEAHKALSKQFEKRTVAKTYHCLVKGHPTWDNLNIDLPLQPDGDDRHRTVVNKRFGKPSKTYFENLGNCGPFSWIIAKPHTGRTHQIRAHLQSTGFPIVCDPLYSGNQHPVLLSDFKRKYNGDLLDERPLLNRLALHAYSLEINHPKTNERLLFKAPYPRDLEAVRKQLSKLFKIDPLGQKTDEC